VYDDAVKWVVYGAVEFGFVGGFLCCWVECGGCEVVVREWTVEVGVVFVHVCV